MTQGERGRNVRMHFKETHVEKDMILTCVRWHVVYPLSFRQLEERMYERGAAVAHSTIQR
jgi:putative transposase